MEMKVEEMANEIAQAADEKKAADILVLDVKGISILADYFVICSGSSNVQVRAIVNSIESKLEEKEVYPQHKEGIDSAEWAVLDYADVIVHVFHEDHREYYQLEKLWGDAKKVDWQQ